MPRVLVTGCAGFIGSFLTEALVLAGHDVVGIDNFFRGKKSNLSTLQHQKLFELVEIDLSTPDALLHLIKILRSKKIDTIYHLAAINGTQHFYDHSKMVLHHNVMMTMQVMEAAQNSMVKKIIYTSSSEVYGEPTILPTPETHPILLNVNANRDSYAASKALGEFYVRLYSEKIGINWLILRVFNTYGPRMVDTQYGQVIPEFIARVQQNKPFSIIGDGHHTRSFCFINDTIRLLLLLEKQHATGIINLGNSEEISILNLAKKIHECTNKKFNPIFLPARPHDHHRRCPNIEKLLSFVQNPQFISLEDGLKQMI